MKIKKSTVNNLLIPVVMQDGKTAQKRYYDDNLKGFGVRVTSGGTKAFFVEKLINRKLCRITLGRYPELTAEMARNKALDMLGKIAMGIDPIAEKHTAQVKAVTLQDVFNDYLQVRKALKPTTITNYQHVLDKAFDGWRQKPLLSITKDKITKQHEKLGQSHGAAYANLSMRVLRALFNFAAGQYEDAQGCSLILENPVRRLSQTRAWYRVERRQTFIKSHELNAWYDGLKQLQNDSLRDYLLLIVLSGLRRQEAAQLTWKNVDLTGKTLTVRHTKNHEDHILPLSDYLYELFLRRHAVRINEYVFPGSGQAGHIIEPRKQMAIVTQKSGISFTIHDLRRTFITIAESLDIPAYALKRLLNHKMTQDVTAGYIMADAERLRRPMQQISNHILTCMGALQPQALLPFPHTHNKITTRKVKL